MNSFVLSIVGCVILEVLASILLPDGDMKKFTLSIISIFLFYSLLNPIIDFVKEGGWFLPRI